MDCILDSYRYDTGWLLCFDHRLDMAVMEVMPSFRRNLIHTLMQLGHDDLLGWVDVLVVAELMLEKFSLMHTALALNEDGLELIYLDAENFAQTAKKLTIRVGRNENVVIRQNDRTVWQGEFQIKEVRRALSYAGKWFCEVGILPDRD